MTSVAERKRKKRQKTITLARQKPQEVQVAPKVSSEPVRHITGLEWLLAKKRITSRHKKAGEMYGQDFRLASTDGMASVRSFLDDSPRGGSGGVGLAEIVSEQLAVTNLAYARAAMVNETGMVEACDWICGRQLTPWEYVKVHGLKREDVTKLEAKLESALNILATHYAKGSRE